MILGKASLGLALPRIINYDCNLCSKLKRTFYDCKLRLQTFIVWPKASFDQISLEAHLYVQFQSPLQH
jgi:hypothetical protein